MQKKVLERVFSILTVLCSVALLSCDASSRLGLKIQFEKKEFSNGLTAILIEDHTAPIVSYQSWFRVGSVDEKPGLTGISHLFEHLMFKGTKKYGEKPFFHRLESKGSEVNAVTSRDYTVFYENVTPDLLSLVIDMEADRLKNCELSENTLLSELQVVLEERRLRVDSSPSGKMQEALWGLAFQVHPYSWPVIGYPQDLVQFKVEDLKNYFTTHYIASHLTLVIAGDFDSKKTLAEIEKAYGDLPKVKPIERKISDEPEQNEERLIQLYDAVASVEFVQGYKISAAENDDSYALDVAANILFKGESSRAYQKLVEDEDLVLGINGTAYTPLYPGLFLISGVLKKDRTYEQAASSLGRLIHKTQLEGVSEEEVSVAIKQLTVQMVESVRTPSGLGQFLGLVQTLFQDLSRIDRDVQKYFGVKPKDVSRVLKKYLQPNSRSVVILSPKELEKKR